jgi:hypothetical protein
MIIIFGVKTEEFPLGGLSYIRRKNRNIEEIGTGCWYPSECFFDSTKVSK